MLVNNCVKSLFCKNNEEVKTQCKTKTKRYDYVICGGGTAACVVAKLLSDNFKISVLLIEAGANRDDDPAVVIPTESSKLSSSLAALYDWQQVSIGQLNINNVTVLNTNGRVLGGGSSRNAMQYATPSSYLLDQWQSISGSPIWGPVNVFNNFTQLETYRGDVNGSNYSRGTNGPLPVRQAPITSLVTTAAITVQTGITTVWSAANNVPTVSAYKDYADPTKPIGAAQQIQLNESLNPPNTRQSTSIVFIDPFINKTTGKGINGRKLKVLTESLVNKVLFDKKKNAIGVNYIKKNGESANVYAKKEVIVSCGAFSCEVLMRSGIGNYSVPGNFTHPEQERFALLSSLSIPKVFDNPNVGQNLRTRVLMGSVSISCPVGQEIIPSSDQNALFTNLSYFPDPRTLSTPTIRSIQFSLGSSVLVPGNRVAGISIALIPSKSVGSVVLQSSNPSTISIFDPNTFGNPDDLNLLTAYYQGTGNLTTISPLNGPGYNLLLYLISQGWTLNSPAISTFQTIAALQTFIRTTIRSVFHYSGTNKMAPLSNGGVVDAECRVHGVKKLRVVDLSVVPLGLDSNAAPVAMVIGWIMGNLIAKHH